WHSETKGFHQRPHTERGTSAGNGKNDSPVAERLDRLKSAWGQDFVFRHKCSIHIRHHRQDRVTVRRISIFHFTSPYFLRRAAVWNLLRSNGRSPRPLTQVAPKRSCGQESQALPSPGAVVIACGSMARLYRSNC